jgi:hypothetical protein
VVAQTITVRIDGDGSGRFTLHGTLGAQRFNDAAEAIAAAQAMARTAALEAVTAMGAAEPQVQLEVRKQWMPNATSDAGLLEAVIEAQAIGRPQSVR